jgi:hypothetical protein
VLSKHSRRDAGLKMLCIMFCTRDGIKITFLCHFANYLSMRSTYPPRRIAPNKVGTPKFLCDEGL